ncbi:hypothetical protein A3B35_00625 [Candidatus Kaiserbacteria bacterium RIFCSPLOWO2_01_FULL_54_24]|uniref:Uncharacterized protein n=1 Tax=Candidatus Kaiserbacteria bacterium RIFCSPLOWO2_01_FULL_54_24 TaxID=1798515 RepID=A0A1F6EW78_9BACT|nr:MAG: hypothetical protein A3B35_00625 [Candidatus Kaiserbacteria bacterium RIFCSPLOWO2_01_FULL_54_24]
MWTYLIQPQQKNIPELMRNVRFWRLLSATARKWRNFSPEKFRTPKTHGPKKRKGMEHPNHLVSIPRTQ